jgi:hypothetical protein
MVGGSEYQRCEMCSKLESVDFMRSAPMHGHSLFCVQCWDDVYG